MKDVVRAWRITQKIHAETAFDGIGASLEGGRWNHKGIQVVYTSESISLAALEILAHLPEEALLFSEYVRIPITFPKKSTISLDPKSLPTDWDAIPPEAPAQAIGTQWAKSRQSLALKVPSTIVPEESNYLINPFHPDFRLTSVGKAELFPFDKRLKV
jgi:RES domain-containing protein